MAASEPVADAQIAGESASGGDRLIAWSCRLAAILAFGTAIGWVLQAPLDVLLRDLSSDDSYYYLQIAREFAQHGCTSLDGRNATNGYHPLWLLLLTLVQLVCHDPVVALRAAKALEFGLVLAATGMPWSSRRSGCCSRCARTLSTKVWRPRRSMRR